MEIEINKKVIEIDIKKLRSFEHLAGGKVKLHFFGEIAYTVNTQTGLQVLEEFKKYLQSRLS